MPSRAQTRLSLEALEDRCVPTLLGNQLFPANNPWNQRVTDAPVAANSAAILTDIVTRFGNNRLHPDFGQDYDAHQDLYGIPYNVVHGNSVAKVSVVIDAYEDESDVVQVPIPATVVLEGDYQDGPKAGVNARGDSHLIIYDVDNNVAYEFYRASRPSENADGKWHADQQTVWDMTTNTFRTLGWTSADAAGLAILPGLVRPDEALPVSQGGQGVITHAIRFTLQNSVILDQFVYPASHTANPGNTNPAIQPPMGARFRLKASVDLTQMNPQARVVAQAMKDYGMIVADNGSNFFFSGASRSVTASNQQALTWDDDDIQDTVHGLKSLRFSDFEVVDLRPRVTDLSAHSGQAGAQVTVVGQNFSGAAGHLKVLFGTVQATSVTVVDDGHLTVVVPAGTGTVDVRVQHGPTQSHVDNVNNPYFGYGLSAISTNARFSYGTAPPPPSGTPLVAVGSDAGMPGAVATYTRDGVRTAWQPFGTFKGGIRVATGDVNDDGVDDLIVAPGVGGSPAVKVYSGATGQQLASFRPFGTSFKGGLFVAAGDVLGLGAAQVVVAPGAGGSPVVKVYDLRAGVVLSRSLQVFGASFKPGLTVGAGDGVLVAAAAGQGGMVKVYDQANLSRVRSLTPFGSTYTAGVTVAAGGSWLAVGRMAGSGQVNVYTLADLALARTVQTQSAGPAAGYAGGTRVAWEVDASGTWELVTGSGPGWAAAVQYWSSATWQRRAQVGEFGGWLGGVWVG